MKKNNRQNEKGSILLMSAVLLSVIMLIGTMIIVVFFRGYVDVVLDIRHKKERLQFQVEAQEVCASINVYDFDENVAVYNDVVVTYDTNDETYSFTHKSEKFLINVVLKYKLEDSTNKLKIIKWQLKEI